MKPAPLLERQRRVARLFTRPVFTAMAQTGRADAAITALVRAGVIEAADGRRPSALFDECLDELRRSYRCEYVYKSAIADRIVFGRHSPRTASMHLELPVGGSIVDVAVFNGTSTAYEIKTEFDSDKRLVSQSSDYLRAFDRVFVVTHPSLVERYAAVVDRRIGLLALTERGRLSEIRGAEADLFRIDPNQVFRMLRRDEYVAAVVQRFGEQPSLPNGALNAHYRRLFAQLDGAQAHAALVGAMRRRTIDEPYARFVSQLPKSLRPLGYATPLSTVQRIALLQSIA